MKQKYIYLQPASTGLELYQRLFRFEVMVRLHSGEITARQVNRYNSENFLKFLKYLDRKYRNVQIHIIKDNLSTHKNRQVT